MQLPGRQPPDHRRAGKTRSLKEEHQPDQSDGQPLEDRNGRAVTRKDSRDAERQKEAEKERVQLE